MTMPLNPRITGWKERRVWVIGASTGIGRATAIALLQRGARVAVSARNAQALQQIDGALPIPLDVTDAQALRAAMQSLQRDWGGLDLLLYCAGTYRPMRATEFDLASALQHDDVNYRGALHALDAALPLFNAQRAGHIALVSSVAGFGGLPQALAYGPTKAALINLAETLYLDLHPLGIGVHVINPGFVETPLTAQNTFAMPALITPEQAAAAILAGLEAGRFDIHFPRRFTLWLKLLRLLPRGLYFRIVSRFTGL
ncbi:MAG TPA: SDR family NAD(P)-dependent oxidoreductase [Thiomonas arsenitoxydans]|jgi:NAD(P)-dependent dehydrogenase (short-subunit alcohol dehydrogenase family)|uniref:SDR family NAD(P)-dependent oxidoreductase n=1 Tax=Thiomonas TaxID=32012 RepID=UPI000BC7F8EB|nr:MULTISPECIES: SDR family NAD(P)-dependent oxidoreductase [Thiomonas]MDE2174478.1 SDR family NAD(P)-dependent oxidoreductase [Betaproteobacteria bacterium]OZB72105.1 MAG: short-chain dehydrogenase [Thiomonas sp. 13-64-67]HML81263.1 SDR family NAD(P)-dependent oxidoreductase [Thiomonas arsenitoxydans]HOI65188.1 SDR family NAD(P)-dependent oxidoreductase [Thiomonas arsenitoxydans]